MLDIPKEPDRFESKDDGSVSPEDTRFKKEYPTLQLWLMNDTDLQFQFDSKAYLGSVNIDDEFSIAQSAYVTRLYKIVAELAQKGVTPITTEEEEKHIGVISESRDMGGNKNNLQNIALINNAFSQICAEFRAFYDQTKDVVTDNEGAAYEDLISILDCLEAHFFIPSERKQPELIALWINNYDPRPENEFIDSIMYNTPLPYKHPQFWTLYLGTLLLRGMFEQAESSLRLCKYEKLSDKCPDLHSIIEDFITLVSTYTSMALKGQFAEWKYTVCEFRDNFKDMKSGVSDPVDVTIASNIHELLCLLSGLPKTTATFVSSWYEMYCALSLYQVRDSPEVYLDYYQLAIHEKGFEIDSTMDEIFRNIASKKYLKVMLLIHELDPATAAFVSTLFELKGYFSSYYADITDQMILKLKSLSRRYVSDYLLTRTAFECFEIHSLVPVAMGILMTPMVTSEDTEKTRKVIAEFLPHYQCLTNDDLEWTLTICTKLKLRKVVRTLLLKQGEKSLAEGYLYEAMNVFVTCLDESRTSKESALALAKIHHIVWDLLFQDVLLNSTPVPDELLTNIITDSVSPDFQVNPIIRQCMAPFAVLTEFFLNTTDESQSRTNINRLFHLLKSKYMPPKFLPLLLSQFLPFLVNSHFEFQDYIIMIDLIDSFELQQKQQGNTEEIEQLYNFAVENKPEDVPFDWRVKLQNHGQSIPQTVDDLIRELRSKIMDRIGRVYIGI